ncbi:MAG: hypothetical protein L0332_34535 [Chloroflexi bacterium]|nr:hypothetical protein [Chloroflexota bacterium]
MLVALAGLLRASQANGGVGDAIGWLILLVIVVAVFVIAVSLFRDRR